MPTIDGEILEIASQPIDSIADVISVFEALEQILPESDGLHWFNQLYLNVTKAVDQSVGTQQWNNPAWIARLDVVFARLYLNALAVPPAPNCWQVFFDARHDARLARIQFAFAGMNAHIDHDLSVAVVQTCVEFGLEPVHLSPIYQDFTRVNELLDTLIDQAKRDLMIGLLGNVLPSLGAVENLIAGFGIRAAREVAWTNAELLWHARPVPGITSRLLDGLDRTATLAGTLLLQPLF